MNCEQIAELLSAYVDEELVPGERSEVGTHLVDCASCLEHMTSTRSLKHAIARLESRDGPPGAVRARVEALRFKSTGFWADPRRKRLLAAAVGIGLLAGAMFAIRRQQNRPPAFGEELGSDYLHSLPEVRPPEVASNDPLEVIRFFSGKTPFAPVVPAVPAAQLLGGRLCNIGGRRVELLFYAHGEMRRSVALFVCDHAVDDTGCREYRGHPVCSRRFGNLTILAVGDVPRSILEQILREAIL